MKVIPFFIIFVETIDIMKNIHILLTDQPSRLFMTKSNKLVLDMDNPPIECIAAQHIYITSDEEIKEGDWFYDNHFEQICMFDVDFKRNPNDYEDCKLIIITTDPTLIADGVQAINDEFVEWFVKNPSCEFVEVKFETLWLNKRFGGTWQPFPDETATVRKKNHKIIIPKVEPKQETLEEAAEHNYPGGDVWTEEQAVIRRLAFKNGAKWQAERMYSEDEVRELIMKSLTHTDYNLCGSLVTAQQEIRTANFNVWFEENKNK